MTLVPHAPEGAICPLHKEDVSKVCHKCPWWSHLLGKNPQSEEMIDDWRCAIAMLPMLLVENSQVTRGTTQAMETFRNGVVASIGQAVQAASEENQLRLFDARIRRN